MTSEQTNVIAKLQDWLAAECNGDWEHSFGVTIESSDNPGWIVKIDLWETQLAEHGPLEKKWRNSESDWGNILVTERAFEGSCSLSNLELLLDEFLYFSTHLNLKG